MGDTCCKLPDLYLLIANFWSPATELCFPTSYDPIPVEDTNRKAKTWQWLLPNITSSHGLNPIGSKPAVQGHRSNDSSIKPGFDFSNVGGPLPSDLWAHFPNVSYDHEIMLIMLYCDQLEIQQTLAVQTCFYSPLPVQGGNWYKSSGTTLLIGREYSPCNWSEKARRSFTLKVWKLGGWARECLMGSYQKLPRALPRLEIWRRSCDDPNFRVWVHVSNVDTVTVTLLDSL